MNHELVMLKGALRMKKNAKEMEQITKKMALKSYCTFQGVCDTKAQAERVALFALERDKLLEFYDAVVSALKITPKGAGALLNQVYLHGAKKEDICNKYNVSLSTLYRKLASARKSFRCNLERLGYSEEWLINNYGHIDWVKELCSFEPGKGGRLTK